MTEEFALAIKEKDGRAVAVAARILCIKNNLTDNVFELADLLSESRCEKYHLQWGYPTWGRWVEDSGLDLGERQAYYLVQIVDSAKRLGIDRDELKRSKISKLKEIFSLDANSQGDDIKRLVEATASDSPPSLEQVRDEVKRAKADSGSAPTTFLNVKLLLEDKENIVDLAIETARREYGDTVGQDGEATDISVGKALTLICADYNAAPHGAVVDVEASVE